MNIIPVIDLKDGVVVSAQQGQRETYKPIESKLCCSSSIKDVVNGFVSIYPFKTMYIADLNAITNSGSNQLLIDQVIAKNPSINFWIDNGTKIHQFPAISTNNYKLIIGSEYQNITKSSCLKKYIKNSILSLDFFPNLGYKGPAELMENSNWWPENVIIMTLERVGKDAGPDFEKLKQFCQKYSEKKIIAAGGVRNMEDLINLEKIGVYHALVSSALHSGVINTDAIKKLISAP